MPFYKKQDEIKTFTQADGAVILTESTYHRTSHQVSFSTTATTGTLAVEVKYHPFADFEPLLDEDGVTPVVVDLSAPKTFQLKDKWVHSFKFTPTGVDGEYKVLIGTGYMDNPYKK
ncbi:hypothetical protein ACOB3G_002335 [Vibrio cholerae]|nr:hypothetical protein [Vibrio cholerae]